MIFAALYLVRNIINFLMFVFTLFILLYLLRHFVVLEVVHCVDIELNFSFNISYILLLWQELAEARKKKRKRHYDLEQVCDAYFLFIFFLIRAEAFCIISRSN